MNEPYSTIHRLSLNIRITLGRIANHSGERRGREKKEEEEEEEETEEEKEEDDQAARITHRPTESFARSLARYEDSYRLRLDTSSTTYDEGRGVHRALRSSPREGRRLNAARSTAATKPPPPLA